MGIATIASPVKTYLPKGEDAQAILSRIQGDLEDAYPIFEERLETRNRNLDFYANRQWDDAEIAKHIEQHRKPYVFNEIQAKVDHLVGTQMQTRLDAKCMPRERGDEAEAELLTYLVKWCEQTNNLEYIETEVFLEALIGGVGAAIIRWEREDIQYGYPKIEKVPVSELMWDVHSRKMDLSDARWMARTIIVTRMDAAEIFPEHTSLIDKATLMDSTLFTDKSPLLSTFHKQIYNKNNSTEPGRDLLEIVEHYERFKRYRYTIADDIAGQTYEFDTEKEAKAMYNGLVEGYTSQGQVLINPDATPRIAMVIDSTDMFAQAIVIGDQLAEYNYTALTDFPFVLSFAYFVDGEYWGFVDSLVDPQRLVNTFFSQWEYQLGASNKNLITVVSSLLRKGITIEDVRREVSKTAPVLDVFQHDAIRPWPNTPVNPELFQGIMFGIDRMTNYAGGKNALGLQENAAESGRAVLARAEQGGIGRLPLFDKLRLWRNNLTLRMVWYIKNFMPSGQIVRITGMDDDVAFVELDDGVLDTLKEIKVDIIIDEAVKSDSMKERNFQQMKELFSVIPGLPPEIVSNIMLEYSGLPQSKKSEIQKQLEFYKTYTQQKAEMMKNEKLTQEVKDSLQKQSIRQMIEGSQQLQDTEQELKKKAKNVKTQLDDIEKMRLQMAEQQNSPTQINQAQSKFLTQDELQNSRGVSTQGAMLGS